MLDALNSIPTVTCRPGLDMKDFEPYRTNVLPVVAYRIEDNIKEGRCHIYKSTHNGQRVAVKIWYGLRPDPRRPEEAHQILRFLERARAFQAQHSTILPDTIDFGLSAAGPYLVQAWCDGETLDHSLNEERTPADSITLCKRLTEATQRLHALGLEHGDLSPANIISSSGEITFIDAIDLFTEAGPHTPAYCPPDYESIPLEQRDCFAVAKLCQELLDKTEATPGVSEILTEVQQCLSYEFRVYRLDRIIDAITRSQVPPKDTETITIPVYTRQVATTELLNTDNGAYARPPQTLHRWTGQAAPPPHPAPEQHPTLAPYPGPHVQRLPPPHGAGASAHRAHNHRAHPIEDRLVQRTRQRDAHAPRDRARTCTPRCP